MRVPKSGFSLVAGASAATAIIALAPSGGLRDVDDKGFFANSYSFIPTAQADGNGTTPCAMAMQVTGETADQPGPSPAPPLQPGETHCSSSHVHEVSSVLHYSWTAYHGTDTTTHGQPSDIHVVGTKTLHCEGGVGGFCWIHTPLSSYHELLSSTDPWPGTPPFHNPVSHTHHVGSDYHYTSSLTHKANSDYHDSNSDTHVPGSTYHYAGSGVDN